MVPADASSASPSGVSPTVVPGRLVDGESDCFACRQPDRSGEFADRVEEPRHNFSNLQGRDRLRARQRAPW